MLKARTAQMSSSTRTKKEVPGPGELRCVQQPLRRVLLWGSEAEARGVLGTPDITNRCPSPEGSSPQHPPGRRGRSPQGRREERCRVSPVCTSREKPHTRKLEPSRSCQPRVPWAAVRPPHPDPHPHQPPGLGSSPPWHHCPGQLRGPRVRPSGGRGSSGRELEDGRGRGAGCGAPREEAAVGPALPLPLAQCPGSCGPLLARALHRWGLGSCLVQMIRASEHKQQV